MKKCIALLAAFLILLGLAACAKKDGNKSSDKASRHHEMINEAIDKMQDFWAQYYAEQNMGDGYFEIKNTRVLTIKENDSEQFSNIAYIIEFEIYTDIMGTAPYYYDWNYNDTVVVYQDGTMEVKTNPLIVYRSTTYSNDFSPFIEKIDDYQQQYNCTKTLN